MSLLPCLFVPALQASVLPAPVQALLERPFEVLAADSIPRGFYPVVASHLAEGCVNLALQEPAFREEAEACVTQAVSVAMDPRGSPFEVPVDQVSGLGRHGLYLAHLGIALGAYAELVGDGRHDPLHGRVARRLHEGSLADPARHFPSFAGDPHRWPADQAAVLRALQLYDRAQGTELLAEPLEAWIAVMEQHRDPVTGLYVSEVTGADASSALPRGCALTWTVRYLAPVAPDAARDQWLRAKEHHLVWLGPLPGFREWPRDRDGPADVDSGPILLGVGTAATAFGLGAARAMGDTALAAGLGGTMSLGGSVAGLDPAVAAVAEGSLAQAIELAMRSQRAW